MVEPLWVGVVTLWPYWFSRAGQTCRDNVKTLFTCYGDRFAVSVVSGVSPDLVSIGRQYRHVRPNSSHALRDVVGTTQ